MSDEIAVIDDGEFTDLTPAPANLFGVHEPEQVVEKATSVANALADVIRKQNLASSIKGREHVRVEGWTLLGSMLGVYPVVVWTRKLEDGWEARVEARTRDGSVIGAAEAECLRAESTWKSRDDYALRSMAQTRATSKALRGPLGFVMTLAGFEATPAEEMPSGGVHAPDKAERLRARIVEIAGPHAQEVLDAVHASFGTGLDELGEHDLTEVGTGLRLWIEGGCQGDFRLVPF